MRNIHILSTVDIHLQPKIYDGWDKVYRMMRIARIKLWKYRMECRKKKAESARKRQGARNRQWQQKWYKKFPEQ